MRIRCALLTLAILATACGDGGGGTAAINEEPDFDELNHDHRSPGNHHGRATSDHNRTAFSPSTTAAPEPVLFTERGPWAVGIATLDLGDRQADVYYPAIPEPDAQTEIFDSLSVFPAELQAFIPSELTGEFDTTAYRDALVANDEQAFPVVAYSHGFGGFRQAATFHTSHIASWGFVVVTTDHIERGIAAQATGTLGGGAENQDVLDVLNAFDALAAHPELGPVSDLDRVAITGHSAGGGTSARAAAEDVIDAYLSIASWAPDVVTQKPTVVFIGETDAVVEPERSYGLFDQLDNAIVVNIATAGHNSFTDSCVGIYELGGLSMLEALIGPEQVARAEDGCVPPAVEPELAYDVLNHYTVQFLIANFIDPAAAGPLVDVSDLITPLVDFRVAGDPFAAS